ncbi:MAG: hypothetical protein ACK4E7_01840 [Permianibacter sp.]
MQGRECRGRRSVGFAAPWRRVLSSFSLFLSAALLAEPVATATAADPPAQPLTGEQWQRFLRASRGRYQALAEKAGALNELALDDCIDARFSLAERQECLRSDVFVRNAMEREGMALDEYALILHLTVASLPITPVTLRQRGQFQHLRAEWWPAWRTAAQ